ncbi:MAG: tetratricopeptide repeat protein [Anaerolineae bacterium]|nr:tetratricopeptide repeat protein [Anaerolineae bacterium]
MLAKEINYPGLQVESLLGQIERYARRIESRLRPTDDAIAKLRRSADILFDEEGFRGNVENYYDPRNSFLNEVLQHRTGIPITLSILFMAVTRRLGLASYGVGLPGHFLVGYDTPHHSLYLDAFNGGIVLDAAECHLLARHHLPSENTLPPDLLLPQAPRMVLLRLLNNLRQIYLYRDETQQLLRVLHLQHSLLPEHLELKRDIGILQAQLRQWGPASRSLRHYLYINPEAEDHAAVREVLNEALTQLARCN